MFKRNKSEDQLDTNVDDNIYGDYMNNEETSDTDYNVEDMPIKKKTSNDEEKHSEPETHSEYQEKQYNNDFLEKHTKVTSGSKVSRGVLVAFYLLIIAIGVAIFFMIRTNRYEFYLRDSSITLNNGTSYQIELIPKNERYFNYNNYKYSIADESVATVDENGVITAKGVGTTTLTVSVKPGILYSKTVRVNCEDISVEEVELGVLEDDKVNVADTIDMKVQQNVSLKTVVNNRDEIKITPEFYSSDESVAKVDKYGNITAVGRGTAVITTTIDGIESSITINVSGKSSSKPTIKPTSDPTDEPVDEPTDDPIDEPTIKPTTKPTNRPTTKPTNNTTPKVIKSIRFGTTNINIKRGDTVQLTAIINPTGLSNSKLTWESSNPNVATVSDRGLVTAKSTGKTTISVKTSNGLSASCVINVTNSDVQAAGIKLNMYSKTMTVNAKLQLTATITPQSATTKRLVWTSDNESVAKVSQTGLVTAQGLGKAVITVVSTDGKLMAKCNITVSNVTPTPTQPGKTTTTPVATAPAGTQFSISQLQLSTTKLTVNKGKTATFNITLNGATGTVEVKSSDSSIAKISLPPGTDDVPICSNGICFLDGLTRADYVTITVTGVKAGTTYINVKTVNVNLASDAEVTSSGKVGILVK